MRISRLPVLLILSALFMCSAGNGIAYPQMPSREVETEPLVGPSFSSLSANEMSLLREYAVAFERLHRFYSDIQMTVTEEIFTIPPSEDGVFPSADKNRDVELTKTMMFKFLARNGKYFLLRGRTYDKDDSAASSNSRVAIIRPDASYLLGLDDGSDEYFLIGHGKDREQYLAELYIYQFPIAPFAYGPFLLDSQILRSHPRSRIESVKLAEDDKGDNIVIVTRSLLGKTSSDVAAEQIFKFYRSRSWAVKSIDYISDNNKTGPDKGLVLRAQQTCEYKRDHQGIPLLERVVCETVSGRPPEWKVQLRHRRDFHITDINSETPPLEVFRVDNYINKFERVGEPRESSIAWLVMSTNGILLLIAAICSILWMRRRRRTT